MPANLAAQPLTMSVAIWIWRLSGNISGAKRALTKMEGSIFFASAWATALSSIADKFPNMRKKEGIEAWYMVNDIVITPVKGKGSNYYLNHNAKIF
jgi:hypothetical protein